ncbi:MAG: Crp/Fnr family transcriptional regulator [Clostridiaceae bacterium]|jgi:CRP-like cAMP-binding protein|nr:Crp/Fnr family transcriptional regulator [Clostridiaceae bacterium]
MKKVCEVLGQLPLFKGLDHDTYHAYCESSTIRTSWKSELIIAEGERCKGVGIILEGQVARQKYTASGEYTTLNLLGPDSVFGEDLIFSSHKRYPYSLEALTHVKWIMVYREDLLSMIAKSPRLLSNYLAILSDRVREQDQRIHLLSQKTLRYKISCYLLQQLEEDLHEQGKTFRDALTAPTTLSIELPVSKEVISKLLAMPRPSFSRELISMEKDGLIHVDGRVIWFHDLRRLSCGLYEDCEDE